MSRAASSSNVHPRINVVETESAENMYMSEDGMRYIGIDGEICYFEEHIEVLDEPLDEIVEGAENQVYAGTRVQAGVKNEEFKMIDPKMPADIAEPVPAGIMIQSIRHQGTKRRKTRQYGSCSCHECGQTFINQARLERHLVTHQIFGSFLCPLCGKVFKYEYNLFHHWRRACFELKDVIAVELRQNMEVNQLRMMVEDLAQKKPEIGPVELGISKSILFQTGPTTRLEIPNNFHAISRRGSQCEACNVFIPSNHTRRHTSLHQADSPFRPDDAMDLGGFICDLCGVCYRFHQNLTSHWRSSCPEILANLPEGELCLDDEQLRDMVIELLVRAKPPPKDAPADFLADHENAESGSSRRVTMDDDEIIVDDNDFSLPQPSRSNLYNDRDTGIIFADDFGPDGVTVDGQGHITSGERSKWRLSEQGTAGRICPECGKTFANQGRLERHQMGYHANFGSHQCILCGNRFKYEYNLLYHYRRSCPYTRAFIEESLRQQLSSNELRKIIRGIAQKKLPNKHTVPFPLPPSATMKDAVRTRPHQKQERVCPPQSLHVRPDLSDREPKPCPVCEVIFYGTTSVNRHIQTAHGMNPEELRAMQTVETDGKRFEKTERRAVLPQVEEDEADEMEPPPKLMPEIVAKLEIFFNFVDQLGKPCRNISKEALDIIRDYLKNECTEIPEVIIQTEDDTKEYEVEIVGSFNADEDAKTVVLNVKSRFKKEAEAEEKNEIVFEEIVGELVDEPASLEEIPA